MPTTIENVDAAIATLRELNNDFKTVNDPSIRLQMWARMQTAMSATKAAEIEMRKAIFPVFFSHEKGTENRDIGGGWTLKGEASLNYVLDKDKIDDALDTIEELGERGAMIAETIVRVKPELSVTEYKSLLESKNAQDQKALAILQTVLTTTPGTPTLTLVPPRT
jgi:hypothetical protein